MENKYYNAKQMKADNPSGAIDEFLGVPGLEPEKGDWYVNLTICYKLEQCTDDGLCSGDSKG